MKIENQEEHEPSQVKSMHKALGAIPTDHPPPDWQCSPSHYHRSEANDEK
jgi:hypothetical protein